MEGCVVNVSACGYWVVFRVQHECDRHPEQDAQGMLEKYHFCQGKINALRNVSFCHHQCNEDSGFENGVFVSLCVPV